MKIMKSYMAIDQYGQTYHIGENPPRKWLLNYIGRKSCVKMYSDTKTGIVHVGYVISGLWLTLYEVTPVAKQVK
jgi:hypothetical protein